MDRNSPFEPVDHESIAEAVVRQIEAMIVSGVLQEGRKLPSERELAETLNVSRPKLREALKTLEDRGLLVVRHGEGSFIAPLTGKAMSPALLSLYGRHSDAFYDYLEYRREQEAFAARLAAQRATTDDKERIAAILDDMKTAWEKNDYELSQKADFALHSAIVDASNNATLIHIMASIYDLTRQGVFYNRDYLRTIDGTGERLLEQHVELGTAIIDGDPARAEKAARDHMDFVEQSFRLGQERDRREALAAKRRMMA
ncbi:FadR family transcriptional regulator [Defluviimonas sp. WL0024]|uniref:Pyruvate dehydrogenase complex repressor n=2 Tax=Albidovulum TaxID=205889 RepID=A0ABT3IY88_9RHOB|nr:MULTISPECIES: FadR/GntR family transcriptional regulator [Defluviimonas]MCU9848620.1 FadR family transcriptional regulator [Defluviimonas sp. WL0024]MCW3780398.1 FadR family transcriptional regulator [Defluviimonas salinarum]